MTALLRLIPLKDLLYAAAIAALLGGFGVYTVHERHVGAAKVEAKDAALRSAALALNKASEDLADIKELNIGKVYEKYVTLPPVPSTGLVCRNTAPAAVKPSASVDRPEDISPPAPRADDVFDPSSALLTDARDADAQINALIDTVKVLKDELAGKTTE